MRPRADDESDRLSAASKAHFLPVSAGIPNAVVAFYIRKGRALRARYIRDCVAGLAAAVSLVFSRPKRKQNTKVPAEQIGEALRTPLTSIRSFSEILRNHPELTQQQRSRYLDIIIEESKRLERVIRGCESKAS